VAAAVRERVPEDVRVVGVAGLAARGLAKVGQRPLGERLHLGQGLDEQPLVDHPLPSNVDLELELGLHGRAQSYGGSRPMKSRVVDTPPTANA
jgi:hypothetical protein